MQRDEDAGKWAEAFWIEVRGKCRGAVARHKHKLRAEARRLELERRAQTELQLEVEEGEVRDAHRKIMLCALIKVEM